VIAVDIDRDDAQAAPVPIDHARLGRHVGEAAPVVAEDVIGQRLEAAGVATDARRAGGIPAEPGMVGIPLEVMADVEVEVAVVVRSAKAAEVGQSRSPPRPDRSVTSSKVPPPRLRYSV
jgi:hypothetical protein